ncbi:thyrotropin-releasing hormone receptor-like [Liolophura sinensis]|uniref:thyrotropin-releasing hormone receptor-like n=1 Tax=Liolophura sinensis TaxID=3198878 RepID=UPI0031582C4D
MTSKYMRQFSFSVYLQTLAVIDTLVLLHYGMDYIDVLAYRNPVFEQRMKRYTPCLFYPYFVRVAQLSSAWCVVAFTVDRSVAICSPFFARHYSTILHARIINAIVILVLMLSQVYHPILLDQDTLYCHNPFSIPTTADRFGSMELMVVISRAALLMLVPFVIVLICNLRVIVAVKRRSTIAEITSSSSDSSNNSSNGRNLEAENKMSLKLFSVSLTFLVLSLPDCIVVFLDIRNMLAGVQRWYLLNNNFRFIASMVFSLNFAINYLLYGFAFRKKAMLFSSLPNCLRRRDR